MKYVYNKTDNKFECSQFEVMTEAQKEIAINAGYVEVTDEQYEKLINHELCWQDSQLVPYVKTQAEIEEENIRQAAIVNETRHSELKVELVKVMEDIQQEQLGIVRDDYKHKRARAAEIINELRVLEGKAAREVRNANN